jgi:hypothetical protein
MALDAALERSTLREPDTAGLLKLRSFAGLRSGLRHDLWTRAALRHTISDIRH